MYLLRVVASAFRAHHYVLHHRSSHFIPCLNIHPSILSQFKPRQFTTCKHRTQDLTLIRSGVRFVHRSEEAFKNKTTLMYVTAVVLLVVGFSYAAVPMYRIFCQSTSYGGEVKKVQADSAEHIEKMRKVKNRTIKIHFNADISSGMLWKFQPHQPEITVIPGETALAFYTATNPTDRPVVGISTYNVIPFDAGQYFNKIQCFCFEEQMLNPHETVDMPVFFYIDPEFAEDPKMEYVDTIMLSYTFFEAKEGMKLPVPQFAR